MYESDTAGISIAHRVILRQARRSRTIAPMREHDVVSDRIRLSVRDHEGGEPALVCLHGLASNARWWDLVAARLAPAHRVVAVDQRGHGRSDRPDSGYRFDDVVADLRGIITALGLHDVVVAGHSWGASVALCYAVAHPDDVVGVVCVDGGAINLRGRLGATWDEAAKVMAPPDLTNVPESLLRSWVEAGPLPEGSDLDTAVEILRGNFEEGEPGQVRPRLSRDHHMQIARALFELDSEELLSQLTRPALFIVADRPGLPPFEPRRTLVEEALVVLGPLAEVRWIDGVHDLPVQRPDEVAHAIEEFASRVAPDAASETAARADEAS
jgi:pimeloyl-ACP methyl ester carboxylesterase